MKLYEIPRGSYFTIAEPPYDSVVFKLLHIDGMYSVCTSPEGDVVHIKAWTEVVLVVIVDNEEN
jgi:hypothetical protein